MPFKSLAAAGLLLGLTTSFSLEAAQSDLTIPKVKASITLDGELNEDF